MPGNTGEHYAQANQNRCPEHGGPGPNIPSAVAEGPERDVYVEDIADKQWGKKRKGTNRTSRKEKL